MTIEQNQIVVKSNELIQAGYRLNLDEQRLILLCISQVDSTKSISSESFFRVTVDEYANRYGLDKGGSYSKLKSIAQSLLSKKIRFIGKDSDNTTERVLDVPWSTGSAYIEGKGSVEIRFAPEVIPHLTNLKNKFTSYNLENVAKMSSTYAIRVYELLVQYKNMKQHQREITIKDLRLYLNLKDNEYKRMFDFKKRIITPVLEQINEHSDMKLKIEDKMEGKRITSFVFKFGFKEHLNRKISSGKASKMLNKILSDSYELPLS